MDENKSLIALVHEITEIERQLIEAEGQLTPQMEELFNLTTGNLKEKADRYKFVMDSLDARAVYFAERGEEMDRASKLFENMKKRLKENLKFAMRAMQTTDLEGIDWRWKLSPLADRLEIDKKCLPSGFFKDEIIKVPDREKIEKALLLGEKVEGAEFKPSESLRPYVNKTGRAKPVKEIEK